MVRDQMDEIDSIEKDPRLENFRVEIGGDLINSLNTEKFLSNIYTQITRMQTSVYKVVRGIVKIINMEKVIPENLNKLYKEGAKLNDEFSLLQQLTVYDLNKNKIVVGKNIVKVSKYYNSLLKKAKILLEKFDNFIKSDEGKKFVKSLDWIDLGEELRKKISEAKHMIDNSVRGFDQIPGKKDWDLRVKPTPHYVVFTTDYNDILGMSSRSDWTSCQDIRPEKKYKDPELYMGVTGSAIEPKVGIIYLTDGSQTPYGEKMLTRATVWIVNDSENKDEQYLLLQAMYPESHSKIYNEFRECLEMITGMKVTEDINDVFSNFIPAEYPPYDDLGIHNVPLLDDSFVDFINIATNEFIKGIEAKTDENAIDQIEKKTVQHLKNLLTSTDYLLTIGEDPKTMEDMDEFAESIFSKAIIKEGVAGMVEYIKGMLVEDQELVSRIKEKVYPLYLENNEKYTNEMTYMIKKIFKDPYLRMWDYIPVNINGLKAVYYRDRWYLNKIISSTPQNILAREIFNYFFE